MFLDETNASGSVGTSATAMILVILVWIVVFYFILIRPQKKQKKQIEELSKTYLESVDAILTPAKEAVKKAEEERYEAIRKFNNYYGAYQTVLTGDRAAKEMIRAINEINSIQRKIWNNTFWF